MPVPGDLPMLSLLILTLPLGALAIWLAPDPRKARVIGLATLIVDLTFSLVVFSRFDPGLAGFQMVEQASWIPSLNVHYRVGVDGISVLFLPMTILLVLGVVVASWNSVRSLLRLYYSLLLLLASVTLGVFCALDTVLFFLFWELTLIPLYFLISLWGIGPDRRYAAVKYTLFMLVGGVPLLFAFLLLAFNHADFNGGVLPDALMFDYATLLATPLPHHIEVVVFLLLLAGFAVKTPVFPLHTWLPVVSMEGPVAVAALMTGLKLGAYGLIRFTVPLAPAVAQEFHWLLAALGVIGVIYGALAALVQTNLRRMLAYASVSHAGLVLLGIASLNLQGLQGALFQLLNFTVVAGGLFLLTGFLHQRTGTTELMQLGGVGRSMPLLAAFFFVFALASMGVPGTAGFPAEFLILMGTLKSHTGAGLAALFGMALGAAYVLESYRSTFYGPVDSDVVATAVDLRRRELWIAVVLTGLILLVGLYPAVVLDTTRETAVQWMEHLKSLRP